MSLLKGLFAVIGVFATSAAVWEGGKWAVKELKKEYDRDPFVPSKTEVPIHRTEHTAADPAPKHLIDVAKHVANLFENVWGETSDLRSHRGVSEYDVGDLIQAVYDVRDSGHSPHYAYSFTMDNGHRVIVGALEDEIFGVMEMTTDDKLLARVPVDDLGMEQEIRYLNLYIKMSALWQLMGERPEPLGSENANTT